jgi:hypothetical protein
MRVALRGVIRPRAVAWGAVIAVLSRAPGAHACGSSGPDGVSACSLAEYEESQRPRWSVGGSALYTSTVIRFSNTLLSGETRSAYLANASYAPTSRLALSAAFGEGIGGQLLAPDGPHEFEPGLVASLGISYRYIEQDTPVGRGFLVGSGQVSFTTAETQLGSSGPGTAYDALDVRVGVAAGLTWARTISLYGAARGFGGPVFWSYHGSEQLGTDTHHYQVGGGAALVLFRYMDIFLEGIPLGEQAVAGGISIAF